MEGDSDQAQRTELGRDRPSGGWLVTPAPRPAASLRLVCIHCAGSGASMYYRWASLLPPSVELQCVQLPGRETRLAEPFMTCWESLSEVLSQQISHDDRPIALFGHSMGALLAFEVTRRQMQHEGSKLVHLFASAHRAPHLPQRDRKYHASTDSELLDKMRRLGGTPEAVFAEPELLALILPALRADLEICETYRYIERPQLQLPITVFGGDADRDIAPTDLTAWSELTSGPCQVELLEGDHFFIRTRADEVVGNITNSINEQIARVA